MEQALAEILTPPVLRHLPPSLALKGEEGAVTSWIDARTADSSVLIVQPKDNNRIVGLIILAGDSGPEKVTILHIGYLLEERIWGHGVASELLQGLVSAAQSLAPITLLAEVDKDNAASARVLQKAGFVKNMALTTPQGGVYKYQIR
ncbi:GNAT family N-acetyltransferase [Loktanella agnita]|uniref:GNAT family N-acetyltransferase n=1 Tax=Loktanella agnita TaxID=287097 RepID=UPI0039894291